MENLSLKTNSRAEVQVPRNANEAIDNFVTKAPESVLTKCVGLSLFCASYFLCCLIWICF